MILIIDSHNYLYEAEALCRMFLRGGELKISENSEIPEGEDYIYTGIFGEKITVKASVEGKFLSAEDFSAEGQCQRLEYLLYDILSKLTGICPKWGTLTGIRPVKMALSYMDSGLSEDEVREKFRRERHISEEKLSLLMTTAMHEKEIKALSRPESVSLYISIPFCPGQMLLLFLHLPRH